MSSGGGDMKREKGQKDNDKRKIGVERENWRRKGKLELKGKIGVERVKYIAE
jgi:hypothetical protein